MLSRRVGTTLVFETKCTRPRPQDGQQYVTFKIPNYIHRLVILPPFAWHFVELSSVCCMYGNLSCQWQIQTLSRGRGVDLLALLAFLPSVVSSFFTQNKPPPKFATACHCTKPGMWYKEKESLKLSTVLKKKKKRGKKKLINLLVIIVNLKVICLQFSRWA